MSETMTATEKMLADKPHEWHENVRGWFNYYDGRVIWKAGQGLDPKMRKSVEIGLEKAVRRRFFNSFDFDYYECKIKNPVVPKPWVDNQRRDV